MENEETESRELVPVEEVDTELVFDVPEPLEPRKIIRGSIVNQLREAYPFACRQFKGPYVGKVKKSKHQRVLDDVVMAIRQGKCTRETVLERTGHCLLATSKALNELAASGILKQSMVNHKWYYEILEPSDEKIG
ncbi:MAG TPA: hypothetical protein VGK38_12180 [Prolixibacteraceae bacterium]|jgi:hypothetical protein